MIFHNYINTPLTLLKNIKKRFTITLWKKLICIPESSFFCPYKLLRRATMERPKIHPINMKRWPIVDGILTRPEPQERLLFVHRWSARSDHAHE
jgi:hypothetical protein